MRLKIIYITFIFYLFYLFPSFSMSVDVVPYFSLGKSTSRVEKKSYNFYPPSPYDENKGVVKASDDVAKLGILLEYNNFISKHIGITTGIETFILEDIYLSVPVMLNLSNFYGLSKRGLSCNIGGKIAINMVENSDMKETSFWGVANINYQFRKIRLGLVYEFCGTQLNKVTSKNRIYVRNPMYFGALIGIRFNK